MYGELRSVCLTILLIHYFPVILFLFNLIRTLFYPLSFLVSSSSTLFNFPSHSFFFFSSHISPFSILQHSSFSLFFLFFFSSLFSTFYRRDARQVLPGRHHRRLVLSHPPSLHPLPTPGTDRPFSV